ncbi:MAG: Hsp33 family molecular chaperone HslO [Alcanivoracaceae bacterium]|nr:Hsp33 family molecular chaperone HslO [Alcanivoracaceae bacterium]
MSNADSKQRFLFPDSDVRGEVLRLETSLAPILQAREYPLSVQGLLSEAMAAVVLMASTLKFDGRLTLQAQGPGPVTLMLAEATHEGEIRGLARFDEKTHFEGAQPSMEELLGEGALMAITIRPTHGNQYQGVVPLDAPTLAACLEHYFAQSEQLTTRIWLAAGNGRAAGLLLQRLPDRIADREHNDDAWQNIEALAGTLTMEELLDLPAETVLHRLFHETPPQLPDAQSLHFGCTCSREKVRHTLLSLGTGELQAILDEMGHAEISCDFCGQSEAFDAVDLAQMIRESAQN